MTYQLPTDADGVKYHGREYDDKGGIIAVGVDEHGNDKPILINTDGSLNMQSVVQELHDIKQRQQEILERLDDPIDTRLTGSIVELFGGRNITLTSGCSVELYRFTSGYDFRKYRMSCRLYSPYPNQWKIEIKYFVQESDIQPNSFIKMDEALVDGERSVGIESNTFSDIATFNVVNESTTDTAIGRSLVLGER